MPASAMTATPPNAASDAGTGVSPVEVGGSAPLSTPSSSGVVAKVPRGAPAAPVVASRGSVANLRKCEACGFPVSEGRQLCLDCERKKGRETTAVAKVPVAITPGASRAPIQTSTHSASADAVSDMPRFLGGEEEESWMATHKFMVVAIVVAVVGIVVVLLVR